MAYGDISAVLDTQQETWLGSYPSVVRLSDGYVAIVAVNGDTDHGWIYTYSIDGSGNITAVDSWDFVSSAGTVHIANISGDKYLIAYRSGTTNYIKSLTISNVGVITESFIDSLESATNLTYGHLTVTGNSDLCFVQQYTGELETFTCDSSGNIGAAILDTESYADYSDDPVVHLANNYYALTAADDIYTFSVDGSGIVTPVDSWDFGNATYSSLLKVPDTTKYILASQLADGDVSSLNISDVGVITKSFIDTLEYEAPGAGGAHSGPHLTHLGGDYFAVNCKNDDALHSTVTTFSCDSDGEISNAALDTLDYTAAVSHMPSKLAHVSGNLYAGVYYTADGNWELNLKTFTIKAPQPTPGTNPGGDINPYKTRISS